MYICKEDMMVYSVEFDMKYLMKENSLWNLTEIDEMKRAAYLKSNESDTINIMMDLSRFYKDMLKINEGSKEQHEENLEDIIKQLKEDVARDKQLIENLEKACMYQLENKI